MEKILRNIWVWSGETYCWSVLKYVFLTSEKMTVEYLTKFTDASYEIFLLNFNDFTITKIFQAPWAGV
jgi:hypothetical protein